jgi:tRNA pseudouridine38-40 synthase
MQRLPHSYLISLQYLGFRFHGWQTQPGVKTVQRMVEKTLAFVLGHSDFTCLGGSRTDAMVSVLGGAVQVFLPEEISENDLLEGLNTYLPMDIRALQVKKVSRAFNILRDVQWKEYHYYFSAGERFHPFCAPFMVFVKDPLDIALMQEGARCFEGTHNFSAYSNQVNEHTQVHREVHHCRLENNTLFQANFFPETSYVLRVASRGFMRNQVRLMAGTLMALGGGKISLEEIRASLMAPGNQAMPWLAPASGLMLYQVEYDEK